METDKSLVELTADRLIKYIIDNHLEAGEQLPNEYDLTRLLNVGRSTVREAVRSLSSRNILEVHQGAGTFLAGKALGIAEDPLGFTFIQDKKKLTLDLLDIRLAIEPRMAAKASQEATAEEIAELRVLLDETEALILGGQDQRQKDIELHVKIAQISRNLVVPNLIPIIQQAISYYLDVENQALRDETLKTHRLIVDAIGNHDAVKAMDAMTLHVLYFMNILRGE
ncbi:MAG: FCD domain-containing protein [Treponema sp.]|jgi:DNA-binding FadR family transcriptional regulator|nr:FCD domain-containing protein [Treponema sp.]